MSRGRTVWAFAAISALALLSARCRKDSAPQQAPARNEAKKSSWAYEAEPFWNYLGGGGL